MVGNKLLEELPPKSGLADFGNLTESKSATADFEGGVSKMATGAAAQAAQDFEKRSNVTQTRSVKRSVCQSVGITMAMMVLADWNSLSRRSSSSLLT